MNVRLKTASAWLRTFVADELAYDTAALIGTAICGCSAQRRAVTATHATQLCAVWGFAGCTCMLISMVVSGGTAGLIFLGGIAPSLLVMGWLPWAATADRTCVMYMPDCQLSRLPVCKCRALSIIVALPEGEGGGGLASQAELHRAACLVWVLLAQDVAAVVEQVHHWHKDACCSNGLLLCSRVMNGRNSTLQLADVVCIAVAVVPVCSLSAHTRESPTGIDTHSLYSCDVLFQGTNKHVQVHELWSRRPWL